MAGQPRCPDDLAPARGLALACAVGALLWAALALAVLHLS